MPDFYRPKHAAPYGPRSCREATIRSEGYQPRHSLATRCHRCSGGTDKACTACVAESQAGLVVTTFTGHGIRHHDYPADIRGIA